MITNGVLGWWGNPYKEVFAITAKNIYKGKEPLSALSNPNYATFISDSQSPYSSNFMLDADKLFAHNYFKGVKGLSSDVVELLRNQNPLYFDKLKELGDVEGLNKMLKALVFKNLFKNSNNIDDISIYNLVVNEKDDNIRQLLMDNAVAKKAIEEGADLDGLELWKDRKSGFWDFITLSPSQRIAKNLKDDDIKSIKEDALEYFDNSELNDNIKSTISNTFYHSSYFDEQGRKKAIQDFEEICNKTIPYYSVYKDTNLLDDVNMELLFIEFSTWQEIGGSSYAFEKLYHYFQNKVADNQSTFDKILNVAGGFGTEAAGTLVQGLGLVAGAVGGAFGWDREENESWGANVINNPWNRYGLGLIETGAFSPEKQKYYNDKGLSKYQILNTRELERLYISGNTPFELLQLYGFTFGSTLSSLGIAGALKLGSKGVSATLKGVSKITKAVNTEKNATKAIKAIDLIDKSANRVLASKRVKDIAALAIPGAVGSIEGVTNSLQTRDDIISSQTKEFTEKWSNVAEQEIFLSIDQNPMVWLLLLANYGYDVSKINLSDPQTSTVIKLQIRDLNSSLDNDIYDRWLQNNQVHSKHMEEDLKQIEKNADKGMGTDFAINSAINGVVNGTFLIALQAPVTLRTMQRITKKDILKNNGVELQYKDVPNPNNTITKLVVGASAKKVTTADILKLRAKLAVGEGIEEYSQNISSEFGLGLADNRLDLYLEYKYGNTETTEAFNNSLLENIGAGLQYAGEAAVSKDALKEGLYGFLSTAAGGVNVRKQILSNGYSDYINSINSSNYEKLEGFRKFWKKLPLEWNSPFIGGGKTLKLLLQKERDELAEKYNKMLEDHTNLGPNTLLDLAASLNWRRNINTELDNGDELEVNSSKFGLLITSLMALRLMEGSLYSESLWQAIENRSKIYDKVIKGKTDEEIDQLVANDAELKYYIEEYRKSISGNTVELIDLLQKTLKNSEILKEISDNAKDFLKWNKLISKYDDKIVKIFGVNVDLDLKETLVFERMMADYHRKLLEAYGDNIDILRQLVNSSEDKIEDSNLTLDEKKVIASYGNRVKEFLEDSLNLNNLDINDLDKQIAEITDIINEFLKYTEEWEEETKKSSSEEELESITQTFYDEHGMSYLTMKSTILILLNRRTQNLKEIDTIKSDNNATAKILKSLKDKIKDQKIPVLSAKEIMDLPYDVKAKMFKNLEGNEKYYSNEQNAELNKIAEIDLKNNDNENVGVLAIKNFDRLTKEYELLLSNLTLAISNPQFLVNKIRTAQLYGKYNRYRKEYTQKDYVNMSDPDLLSLIDDLYIDSKEGDAKHVGFTLARKELEQDLLKRIDTFLSEYRRKAKDRLQFSKMLDKNKVYKELPSQTLKKVIYNYIPKYLQREKSDINLLSKESYKVLEDLYKERTLIDSLNNFIISDEKYLKDVWKTKIDEINYEDLLAGFKSIMDNYLKVDTAATQNAELIVPDTTGTPESSSTNISTEKLETPELSNIPTDDVVVIDGESFNLQDIIKNFEENYKNNTQLDSNLKSIDIYQFAEKLINYIKARGSSYFSLESNNTKELFTILNNLSKQSPTLDDTIDSFIETIENRLSDQNKSNFRTLVESVKKNVSNNISSFEAYTNEENERKAKAELDNGISFDTSNLFTLTSEKDKPELLPYILFSDLYKINEFVLVNSDEILTDKKNLKIHLVKDKDLINSLNEKGVTGHSPIVIVIEKPKNIKGDLSKYWLYQIGETFYLPIGLIESFKNIDTEGFNINENSIIKAADELNSNELRVILNLQSKGIKGVALTKFNLPYYGENLTREKDLPTIIPENSLIESLLLNDLFKAKVSDSQSVSERNAKLKEEFIKRLRVREKIDDNKGTSTLELVLEVPNLRAPGEYTSVNIFRVPIENVETKDKGSFINLIKDNDLKALTYNINLIRATSSIKLLFTRENLQSFKDLSIPGSDETVKGVDFGTSLDTINRLFRKFIYIPPGYSFDILPRQSEQIDNGVLLTYKLVLKSGSKSILLLDFDIPKDIINPTASVDYKSEDLKTPYIKDEDVLLILRNIFLEDNTNIRKYGNSEFAKMQIDYQEVRLLLDNNDNIKEGQKENALKIVNDWIDSGLLFIPKLQFNQQVTSLNLSIEREGLIELTKPQVTGNPDNASMPLQTGYDMTDTGLTDTGAINDKEVKPTNTIVDRIKKDVENLKLTDDELYYTDNRESGDEDSKQKYFRVTSLRELALHGKLKSTMDYSTKAVSTSIGNAVDEVVRDYFSRETDDEGRGIIQNKFDNKKYKNINNQEDINKMLECLKQLRDYFDKLNIHIISSGVTVQGSVPITTVTLGVKSTDNIAVAGTLDLLGYNDAGKFFIYDIKTKHSTSSNAANIFDDKEGRAWAFLVNMYKKLLSEKYGIDPNDIVSTLVIPFSVNYGSEDFALAKDGTLSSMDTEASEKDKTLEINGIPYVKYTKSFFEGFAFTYDLDNKHMFYNLSINLDNIDISDVNKEDFETLKKAEVKTPITTNQNLSMNEIVHNALKPNNISDSQKESTTSSSDFNSDAAKWFMDSNIVSFDVEDVITSDIVTLELECSNV